MIDPFEGNWKPCTIKPKDDQNILMSWKSLTDPWKGPYIGYYCEDEDRFFLIEGFNCVPVQIDIWIEMPKLPN